MSDTSFVVGLWKLHNMKKITSTGTVLYPFGENPLGYILYTEEGFMVAILMNAKRAHIGVTLEELGHAKQTNKIWYRFKYLKALVRYLQAATSCIAYCGTYDIKDNYIFHHVHASLFPDWIGTDLKRAFVLEERAITLTAYYPNGDKFELIWERT